MSDLAINLAIGRTLRAFRRRRGLTQEAVAEHLGVSLQQVQKYEKGVNAVSCPKLLALADLFDCALADLLPQTEEGAPTRSPIDRADFLIARLADIRSAEIRQEIRALARQILRAVSPDERAD